jgi:RNA polymerase sigma factor (sigma-70 family)
LPGKYDHITDAELLQRHQQDGDTRWIGILLERYTLLLLGVCMKYLKNEAEARDAVQQIFLKVLGEVGRYKIEFFKSWIYMVAKNHCLMKLRAAGKPALDPEAQHLKAPEENRDELWQNERTYTLLEQALEDLGPEQKRCVILFYLKKKSYKEISDLTGFSTMQVKSYIQNGKRNLRTRLEKQIKGAGNE